MLKLLNFHSSSIFLVLINVSLMVYPIISEL